MKRIRQIGLLAIVLALFVSYAPLLSYNSNEIEKKETTDFASDRNEEDIPVIFNRMNI